MSFPLLRLPELVLGEILKNYDPKEKLFLVQTSQRARRLISKHTKLHTVKIRIVDSYVEISSHHELFFRILIETVKDHFFRSLQVHSSWRFNTVVPVRYQGYTLVSLWKRDDTSFQEILDLLNEVFRIKEVSFEIVQVPSNWIVPVLEHVNAKNLKIGSVELPTSKENEEMAERLLMASRGASCLKIKGFNFPTIHFNHFHLFRMDYLMFRDASFMTVENIVDLRNCKRVFLDNVLCKEVDMNKILREYMKNPGNLQELRMTYYGSTELEEVVKDLNIVEIEVIEGRYPKYWLITDNGIRFSVTKGSSRTVVMIRDT
uniref:F-box domain-containing protein n=1 Tax=Caenorhabditis tropicalis TaxID=1561998 RepID=A0A1I7UT72_9PELO